MAVTRRGALRAGFAVATAGIAGCLGDRGRPGGTDDGSPSGTDARTIETLEAPGSPGGEIPLVADAPLTLLYFFATWCAPCEPQNEALAEVSEQIDDAVAMRALSPEPDDAHVRDYWAKSPSSFPVAIDAELRIHDAYDVAGYPSLVLLAGDGTVRWKRTGLADAETVREAIDEER